MNSSVRWQAGGDEIEGGGFRAMDGKQLQLGDLLCRMRGRVQDGLSGLTAVDAEAWATLNSDMARPFDKKKTGRIAVMVTNPLGDKAMKVAACC